MRYVLFALAFSLPAMGTGVGEIVKNYCWQDQNEKTICMDDHKNEVRVLIFSAGWCPPCNAHLPELAKKVEEFKGKKVYFINLSLQGWKHGTPADTQFLKEWATKHGITFDVAAAPVADYKDLIADGHIPAEAIIDQNGKLIFGESGASVSTLFAKIKALNP